MSKLSVNIISLGCAKNLVDSEILIGGLKKSNISITDDPEDAGTVIINTCGFLDQAREESIDVILQAATLKKEKKIDQLVVVGCLSERYPEELKAEIPEVDRFFGTSDHRKIVSFLTGKDYARDDPMFWRSLLTPSHYAYLKIAEGCDNGCSFCSIPIMRGKQISRPIAGVVAEATRLVENGVKELLVIAQDSTSYGWDLPGKVYLSDLIVALDELPDPLEWIRIHYAHPAHLADRIIQSLARTHKAVHYIDLPIQHASDRILKSMNRGLNQDGIRKRIDFLKQAIPDIRIRTTVIVGYPGETDGDFNALYNFLNEMAFDRLGIFTYSEEEGTSAAGLDDNVPREVKDERKAVLTDLFHDQSAEKNKRFEGNTMKVLIDEVGTDISVGRTEYDSPEVDNIVRVSGKCTVGEFVPVKIDSSNAYELIGHVSDSSIK
ncbi:MAG: 30S ribosomal protein S12 methylthiotransferase RimO [Fidelibacterota bacterium]